MPSHSLYRRLFYFGLLLPLLILICRNRSLWLDEAALGYNIVSRSYSQLLHPLSYAQASPIGYLLASKACNSLFGYNDIAIRIPSIIAYLCVFLVLAKRAHGSMNEFLRFSLIISAAGVINYAFELKQYIYDILFMIVLLEFSDIIFSSNRLTLLFSVVSVLFSNVTFIQLPLFFLVFSLKQFKARAILNRLIILRLLLADSNLKRNRGSQNRASKTDIGESIAGSVQ